MFWDKKKEVWDWKFKRLNDSDYELVLDFTVDDTFFMKIYKQGVLHFTRSHAVHVVGDVGLIEEFDIDPQYLDKMKSYVSKPFEITKGDVFKKVKCTLISYDVMAVKYRHVKDAEKWNVLVTIQGVYLLKN